MNKNSTEAFFNRLDGSRHSIFVVAEYLHRTGFNIHIPEFDFRPPNSNWKDHTDNGDMYIWKEPDKKHRIDVKHSSAEFTCADNYPYREVLVSDIRAIQRATPFPLAYIIVNKSCSHIGIVWGRTKSDWTEKTLFAKNTDREMTAMACPLHLVDFRSLND